MVKAKRFRKVGLGGTFDIFHKGHEHVLDLAFQLAEKVSLALSTDEFAFKLKGRRVNPYEERKKKVEEFLRGRKLLNRVEFIPLEDRFGTAVEDPEMDALLVSSNNKPVAETINRERVKKGLKPLEIIVFKKVLAENGKPISASRIMAGEIDREGRVNPALKR